VFTELFPGNAVIKFITVRIKRTFHYVISTEFFEYYYCGVWLMTPSSLVGEYQRFGEYPPLIFMVEFKLARVPLDDGYSKLLIYKTTLLFCVCYSWFIVCVPLALVSGFEYLSRDIDYISYYYTCSPSSSYITGGHGYFCQYVKSVTAVTQGNRRLWQQGVCYADFQKWAHAHCSEITALGSNRNAFALTMTMTIPRSRKLNQFLMLLPFQLRHFNGSDNFRWQVVLEGAGSENPRVCSSPP
jgi:hypothetical protein